MALSDLSFKLYTDDGLTTLFNGTLQLTHQTDLSDNPQDFVLYFGSNTADRVLEASSNPGVDNITLTPTDTLDDWTAATAYDLGDIVEPTTPNGLKYKVTAAGTSHATTEPTWPTTGIGSTVSDGTVIWALVGDRHETSEIILAANAEDLDTNTPGAALSLGTSIDSEVANLVEVHVRIVNAAENVSNNAGQAEIGVFINSVQESEAV